MKNRRFVARGICIVTALFALLCILLLFTGCATEAEQLDANIQELQEQKNILMSEVNTLKAEKNKLQQEIVDTKVENGTAKYVLTINIKQTHITLDLKQHLKDAMNDILIQIPVDKEYFDSVKVGDVLDDSFRVGSLIFKGSWGSWKVTIQDKTIV